MEPQIDRPLIRYGLAEVEYDIKLSSTLADENKSETIIDIVKKIVAAHNKDCALKLKITWVIT